MTIKKEYAPSEFCWVDLVSHDMAEAKAFYGALFGWKCVEQETHGGPPYGIFDLDGNEVAGIGQMSDEMLAQGIPPMWNNYVNVADVASEAKRAEELGGTITVPPMKVLDAGWLAFLQDPTGAQLALWQKGEHCGATLVNATGSFCWNELATRDIEAAREFYGQLFGWTYEEQPGTPSKYYIIKVGDRMGGGLMQMTEEWGDIPPHWTVYFTVDDADAAAAQVGKLNGKVHVPPFNIPVGRMAVVADPQGGTFSVIKLNEAAT